MKPHSGNPRGDMPADEFRRHGHAMVEWIARFMKNPERFPVLAEVAPGDIRNALPEAAPEAAVPQVRTRGLSGRADVPCLRVCCSGQAHSSIEKGVILAGLGQEGRRTIASEAECRMRPDAVRAAIGEDRAEERRSGRHERSEERGLSGRGPRSDEREPPSACGWARPRPSG